MKGSVFLGLIMIILVSASCTTQHTAATSVIRPGPHAVVYKTKADYSKYVPVTLSDDKTKIVSYPAPQDVYYQGKLATPDALAKGYLLDNRGVTVNSVFIKITYEDYAKMKDVPSLEELYKLIIDKSPFTEMYDLGNRSDFKEEKKEIDTLIKKHKLKNYKKLI